LDVPGVATWLDATQTTQKWNMFSNPRPRGWAIEAWATTREGEEVLAIPSVARHPEDLLRLRYSRFVKLQANLAQKAGRSQRPHFAAWVCTQGDYATVELRLFTLKRPTREAYLGDPESRIAWTLHHSEPTTCP